MQGREQFERRSYESRQNNKDIRKFTTHAHHLDKLYYKKILDKIIPISKDVKHPLSSFLNNSKFNGIGG